MKASGAAWVSAEEAVARLGVTRGTLYAYVSRGRIRSEPVPGETRRRRYASDDIERLLAHSNERRDPEKAATQALHFGLPILESAITLISDGRFFYRGYDATELARSRSVAEVAALIWTGDFDTRSLDTRWPRVGSDSSLSKGSSKASCNGSSKRSSDGSSNWSSGGPFIARAQSVLAELSAADTAAYDFRETAVVQAGWRIVNVLAQVAALSGDDTHEVDELLAQAWGVPTAREAIRAALILCADHELNVSAFAARCVASAGTSVYGVTIAGLAALEGYKHGGVTARIESLWDSLAGSGNLKRSLDLRLRRGEPIDGFGHPLYPAGDPRAASMLGSIPPSEEADFANRLIEAAYDVVGEHPVVDFALVALARSLKLPDGAALTLFALGRTIGWVGHAIEQYASQTIIRPRARYVGDVPAAVEKA